MLRKIKNVLSLFWNPVGLAVFGFVIYVGSSMAMADYQNGAWVDEELFLDENGNVVSIEPTALFADSGTSSSREDKNITIENVTIANCNVQDGIISGLTVRDAKGIKLRNVEIDFTGCSGSTPRYGIYLDNGEIDLIENVTIKGAWRGIYSENGSLIDKIDNVNIEMSSPETFPKVGIYNLDSTIETIDDVTVGSSAYIGIYNKGSSIIGTIKNSTLTPKATFTRSTGKVDQSTGLGNRGAIGTLACSNTIT